MNRSQTVRSLINEITSITSHPSDDLLENDETRQKILDCSRKLTVAAENPGDVAFQTSLLVSSTLLHSNSRHAATTEVTLANTNPLCETCH